MSLRNPVASLAACAALAFILLAPSSARAITWTIDTTGGASGLTPIANTTGNIGNYAAGSWLTLTGSISASQGSLSASGNFAVESGFGISGSYPNGNPGSLVAFYQGTIEANIDNTTLWFPGASNVDAIPYSSHYPQFFVNTSTTPTTTPLRPQIGGGPDVAHPGTDIADYGVHVNLIAVIFSAAEGDGALRNVALDLEQKPGVLGLLLSGPAGNQTFQPNNNVAMELTNGTLDYNLDGKTVLGNVVPDIIGTTDIFPSALTTSTGSSSTGKYTLTPLGNGTSLARIVIPLKVSIVTTVEGDTPATATTTFTGQIAAYAIVPEPSSVLLLAVGSVLAVGAGLRRRRS